MFNNNRVKKWSYAYLHWAQVQYQFNDMSSLPHHFKEKHEI